MQKRFPRFRAEILTPSACYTILSQLRLRLSTRFNVFFPLAEGGGLKACFKEKRDGRGTKKERTENARQPVRQPLTRSTLVPAAVEGVGRGVRARGGVYEAPPWLGSSRRGVVITSRSDRVPLLSRRHTPAEKQNGTSDRPTDRPTETDPSTFACLTLLHFRQSARYPGPRFSFSLLTLCSLREFSRDLDLTKYSRPRNCRHVARATSSYIATIDVVKAADREKEKRPGRRSRARRVEYTYLFQSSRGTRDSIREINDRTRESGRSSPERPRATRRNPVYPSFRFEERRTRKGELPSRRANRKRDWEYR